MNSKGGVVVPPLRVRNKKPFRYWTSMDANRIAAIAASSSRISLRELVLLSEPDFYRPPGATYSTTDLVRPTWYTGTVAPCGGSSSIQFRNGKKCFVLGLVGKTDLLLYQVARTSEQRGHPEGRRWASEQRGHPEGS